MAASRFRPLLITLAAFLAAAPAGAATPMETVRDSNAKVLQVYTDHETVDAATENKIYAIIDDVTDFEGIADAATSRSCRDLSEEQCRRFNEVFIRLLRISSIKKLGRYRADSFTYLEEEAEGAEAAVRTIAHFKDEEISLDYTLRQKGDGWVITNYIVDDVDTVRNYRKQFKRLFAQKTFEEVIERLEGRITSYEQEENP